MRDSCGYVRGSGAAGKGGTSREIQPGPGARGQFLGGLLGWARPAFPAKGGKSREFQHVPGTAGYYPPGPGVSALRLKRGSIPRAFGCVLVPPPQGAPGERPAAGRRVARTGSGRARREPAGRPQRSGRHAGLDARGVLRQRRALASARDSFSFQTKV